MYGKNIPGTEKDPIQASRIPNKENEPSGQKRRRNGHDVAEHSTGMLRRRDKGRTGKENSKDH